MPAAVSGSVPSVRPHPLRPLDVGVLRDRTRRHVLDLRVPRQQPLRGGRLAGPRATEHEHAVRRLDGRDLFWWGTRTPGALVRLAAVLSALRSND